MRTIELNENLEVTNPNFRKDTKMLEHVAKTRFNDYRVLVAGGSCLDTLLGREYNDIDIWVGHGVYSEQGLRVFAQELFDNMPKILKATSFEVIINPHGIRYDGASSFNMGDVLIHCEHRTYNIQVMSTQEAHFFSQPLVERVFTGFSSLCTRVGMFENSRGKVVLCGALEYHPYKPSPLTFLRETSVDYIKKTVLKYSQYFGMNSFRIRQEGGYMATRGIRVAPLKLTKLTSECYSSQGLWGHL